jgi:hypothetical protein
MGETTAASVLAYAQRSSQSGFNWSVGKCQKFVRSAFGSAGGALTAVAAWNASGTQHRGDGNPPAGAAVYWSGGAGHAAISAGNGMVYSTDAIRPGKVDLVSIDWLNSHWGKPYLGWSESTNEKKITKFNATPVDPSLAKAGKGNPAGSSEAGAGAAPGSSTTAGGGVSTHLDKKALAADYGYAAAFFNSSPELRRLLDMAVKGQWDAAKFTGRLMNTTWYKEHTSKERSWIQLTTADPAEAKRQMDERRNQVVQTYRSMGVAIPPKRLDSLVTDSLRFGWNDDQIQDAVASEFDYKAGKTYGGAVGQTVDQLKKLAADYVVPISDKTMDAWTTHVLRGEATPDSFTSYLKTQAKSMFPELSAALDSGVTTVQYLDPYAQTAAQTLGINPDEVNWLDPKWSGLVFKTDPATGTRGVQSLADATRTLRTDTTFGYDKSAGAQSQAASLGLQLTQLMGARG